jgi:hypothetical protein
MKVQVTKKVILLILGVVGLVAFARCAIENFADGSAVSRTRMDLRTYASSTEHLATELLDINHWDQVRDAEQFLARITPYLESGRTVWHDAWDQPYELERLDEADRIVFTLRSTHKISDGTLGIEITFSRSDGKVTQVKDLWRD